MFELFSLLLIASITGIIGSIGAIIFSTITKRPNTIYIRVALGSLVLFLVSTVGLISIN